MKSFAERLSGKKKSAATAKERLQLLLIHDRTNLPPGLMEDLRDELIEVISRHLAVDRSGVRLEMTHEGRKQRLLADIPLQASQPKHGASY
jgi:cell division topological specificity factor